jgi:hypothetical protein
VESPAQGENTSIRMMLRINKVSINQISIEVFIIIVAPDHTYEIKTVIEN